MQLSHGCKRPVPRMPLEWGCSMQDWAMRFEEAKKRHDAAKATRDQQGLTRIGGTRSELPLPPDVFSRLGGTRTRQGAIWTCSTCGISPQPRQFANGFVPGKCPCQVERIQREREEAHAAEQRKAQMQHIQAQCAKCYTWLGSQWSGIGLEDATFQTFNRALQPEGFAAAVDFSESLQGNLVFWSDRSWGTGKTHLAAAICNHLLAQNVSCRFTTAQGLFDAFAARMDDHQGYSDLLAQASKTPLLVIDDLDKVHMTSSGYKLTVFFEVLNQRYLRHVPTVITTNTRVQVTADDVIGLSDYVGRAIASRMCDTANGGLTVIEMSGEDYRRRERI